MTERFVILGSSSFSGASFLDFILRKGAEAVGISRSPEPSGVFLPYKWREDNSYFQFYSLDINHDLNQIMEIIYDFKPDCVVNFAAQGMVAQSWEYPEHWFTTNVVSMVKLHNQLRHCKFLKKYVHVTTPEVYGNCEGYVTEEQVFNPSTPYAVSRAACDMSLKSFFSAYRFPVVFTRSANVFGPGQQLYRIIPRTILYIKLQKKLQLHGGGHSIRSFIHIHDVADGILRVAQQAPLGETYHLATKETISIKNLVKLICQKMGANFQEAVEISEERLGKDSAYLLDSSKARETLGWKDKISLETGIDETIRWINNNLEELKKQPYEYIHKS